MNIVQPIKCKKQVEELRATLATGSQGVRNVFLINLGLLCPARISDLLILKVVDVRGVRHIKIKENKTGKFNEYTVNNYLAKIITEYTEDMSDEDYLFPSRTGTKPIGRKAVWKLLNKASDYCGLDLQIGCHSLRKTYGYHYYNLNPSENLAKLQKIFKHSSSEITLRYIGIEQEEIDSSMEDLSF